MTVTVRRRGDRVRCGLLAALLAGAMILTLSASAAARPAPPAHGLVAPGLGSFVFDGYPPLADRPVRVWYVAPPDPATARIVVVMHGLSRDGRAHRDDWARLVGGHDVLVLVPELAERTYPDYNIGHVVDDRGVPQPPRLWTFQLVESLFDHVVADTGSHERDYALFGFSGGAQFVHRFVELMPQHRVRVAVAASAGWYTMPDGTVPFPYGLGGAPVQADELGPAFAANLVVILGGRDTDPNDPSLNRDPRAQRQGAHRLERGRTFFRAAASAARALSLTFGWRLREVPGLGHRHADAARAALPYVLDGH